MTMQAQQVPIRPAYLDWLGKPGTSELGRIPGDRGQPVLGHTLPIFKDLYGFTRRMHDRYGKVFRVRFLFRHFVWLLGPDATQLVLVDREKILSSTLGWDNRLGKLFAGGLMLRDFEEHRFHRRLMQVAFSREALEQYVGVVEQVIDSELGRIGGRTDLLAYPEVKRISLRAALRVFVGNDVPDAELERITRAFIALLGASISFTQLAVPGTVFHRGIRARRFLADFIRKLVPGRRSAPGRDLLSHLCTAQDPAGLRFSAGEVADHMIFLLMAAHDTTASALTTALYGLAKHPRWQSAVRDECAGAAAGSLTCSKLDALDVTEWTINEGLRLFAPVGMLPRRTVAACSIHGYDLPPNTALNLSPGFNHHMPEYWRNPSVFDPERFSPQRAEHRQHPFLWIPFGAGAHKCIGMQFAYMEAKVFLAHLLRRMRVSVADDYEPRYVMAPVPRPVDGLPLAVSAVR